LLALSRRDARVVTRFGLERAARSGVQTLTRVLPAGVALSFEASEAVEVDADETELQQVLFNLVLNARDALPQNGGKIQVNTGAVSLPSALDVVGGSLPPGRYAALRVQDNGCGIDPAIRERIFELFFTTKAVGLGTGLGLATVLRIASESSGGITVDSSFGADAGAGPGPRDTRQRPSGATFTLYLPVAKA
jgi:two-component system, cell cycle sensor histidine kinase and response regulator CckA